MLMYTSDLNDLILEPYFYIIGTLGQYEFDWMLFLEWCYTQDSQHKTNKNKPVLKAVTITQTSTRTKCIAKLLSLPRWKAQVPLSSLSFVSFISWQTLHLKSGLVAAWTALWWETRVGPGAGYKQKRYWTVRYSGGCLQGEMQWQDGTHQHWHVEHTLTPAILFNIHYPEFLLVQVSPLLSLPARGS